MSETHEHGDRSGASGGFQSGARSNGSGPSDGPGKNAFRGTREKLKGFANAQKDAGLDQVESLAQATHKAAESLDDSNSGIAGLLHEAADGLGRMSQTFRSQDVHDIYGTVHDFARRQPLTFMAGSFAAGLVLARFLKTSGETTSGAPEQPYHRSPKL